MMTASVASSRDLSSRDMAVFLVDQLFSSKVDFSVINSLTEKDADSMSLTRHRLTSFMPNLSMFCMNSCSFLCIGIQCDVSNLQHVQKLQDSCFVSAHALVNNETEATVMSIAAEFL